MLSLAAVGLACSPSTTMKNSWRDPSVTGPLDFKKVLVLMLNKDGTTRRTVEDKIAGRITTNRRVEAVPSYTLLMGSDLQDQDHAKQIVLDAGFDGAVVMRLVGVDKQTTYVPGSYPSYYGSFWGPGGYYGYGWPAVYDPGYLQTDTIVNIETLIYSLKDNKLVWTGTTETFNPSSLDHVIDGVASAVSMELTKQGLVKQ